MKLSFSSLLLHITRRLSVGLKTARRESRSGRSSIPAGHYHDCCECHGAGVILGLVQGVVLLLVMLILMVLLSGGFTTAF